jgi:hypothetical protein
MSSFKTRLLAFVIASCAFSPLKAASSSNLHVKIPFPFVVAGQSLPAGQYVIDTGSNSGVLMIQGEGRGVIVLTTPASGSKDKPGLLFQHRANGEHLTGVRSDEAITRQISEEVSTNGKVAALAAVAAK